MYLASNLKYLRDRRGETQKDLSALLKVSEMSVSRYESGENEPELLKVIAIAEHFNVRIDDLLKSDLRHPASICGRNLKYLRGRYEMSQGDMARLLNTRNQQNVSRYELGQNEMSIEQMLKVADYFGVTLDQFIKQDLSEVME